MAKITKTFVDGQVLYAADMNEVKTVVNGLDDSVTTVSGQITTLDSNTIKGVKVAGVELVKDADGKVNITNVGGGNVDDVTVNGVSVLDTADKIAKITVATGATDGSIKVNGTDISPKGVDATLVAKVGALGSTAADVTALVNKVGALPADATAVASMVAKVDSLPADVQEKMVAGTGIEIAADGKTISVSGSGTSVEWADVANKPTTLAGYGVASTDAMLAAKVDVVAGKGLSTNDYTAADKAAVAALGTASTKAIADFATAAQGALADAAAPQATTYTKSEVDAKFVEKDSSNPVITKDTLEANLPAATSATAGVVKLTDTYSATSSDAVSGKAVKAAIDAIPDGSASDKGLVKLVSTYSATGTEAVTGAAVAAALDSLDKADAAVALKYVSAVSEADGIITVSREELPIAGVKIGSSALTPDANKVVTVPVASNTAVGVAQASKAADAANDQPVVSADASGVLKVAKASAGDYGVIEDAPAAAAGAVAPVEYVRTRAIDGSISWTVNSGGSGALTDVKVGGVSVTGGSSVATIPNATASAVGVVMGSASKDGAISVSGTGEITAAKADGITTAGVVKGSVAYDSAKDVDAVALGSDASIKARKAAKNQFGVVTSDMSAKATDATFLAAYGADDASLQSMEIYTSYDSTLPAANQPYDTTGAYTKITIPDTVSIAKYVEDKIPAGVLIWKGTIDSESAIGALGTPEDGWEVVSSSEFTTSGTPSHDVHIGDALIYNATAAGWQLIPHTGTVTDKNVVLDATGAKTIAVVNGSNITLTAKRASSTEDGLVKIDNTTIKTNSDNKIYVPVATTSAAGLVQPDGTTVEIDAAGKISVKGMMQFVGTATSASGTMPASVSECEAAVTAAGKTLADNMIVSVEDSSHTYLGQMICTSATAHTWTSYSSASVPDATTASKGIVKLAATYDSTDTTLAATGSSISAALQGLDVTDSAVAGKYVSQVSETDGKVTVTRADLVTGTTAATASDPIKFTLGGAAAENIVMTKASASAYGDVLLDTTAIDSTSAAKDDTKVLGNKAVEDSLAWKKVNGKLGAAQTDGATASADYAIAAGTSTASGIGSFALGALSTASGTASIALGSGASATKSSAFAVGDESKATGENAFAAGYKAKASGVSSVAMGAEGTETHEARGARSVVLGSDDLASGVVAIAIGAGNTASGNTAIAIGSNNTSSGYASIAGGMLSTASSDYAIALGNSNFATEESSVAIGKAVTATNNVGEIALGKYNVSNTDTALSVGIGTAPAACKNGFEIKTNGDIYIQKDGAAIKLQDNLGGGDACFAFNNATTPANGGIQSDGNTASGAKSFAVGSNNAADGAYNISLGANNNENGDAVDYAYLIGDNNDAYADGDGHVAAIGSHLSVGNTGEVALGTYNVHSTDTAFSVGIGTASDPRNGLEVKQDGSVYYLESSKYLMYNSTKYFYIGTVQLSDEWISGYSFVSGTAHVWHTNSKFNLSDIQVGHYVSSGDDTSSEHLLMSATTTGNGGIVIYFADGEQIEDRSGFYQDLGPYEAIDCTISNAFTPVKLQDKFNECGVDGIEVLDNGSILVGKGEGMQSNKANAFVTGSYNNGHKDAIFSVGIGTSDSSRKNAIEVDSNGTTFIKRTCGGTFLAVKYNDRLYYDTGYAIISSSGAWDGSTWYCVEADITPAELAANSEWKKSDRSIFRDGSTFYGSTSGSYTVTYTRTSGGINIASGLSTISGVETWTIYDYPAITATRGNMWIPHTRAYANFMYNNKRYYYIGKLTTSLYTGKYPAFSTNPCFNLDAPHTYNELNDLIISYGGYMKLNTTSSITYDASTHKISSFTSSMITSVTTSADSHKDEVSLIDLVSNCFSNRSI